MKTLSIILAAAIAVSSTTAMAGNVLNAGTSDDVINLPPVPEGGSMGSLGGNTGVIIAGVVGLALLAAALDSGGGSEEE